MKTTAAQRSTMRDQGQTADSRGLRFTKVNTQTFLSLLDDYATLGCQLEQAKEALEDALDLQALTLLAVVGTDAAQSRAIDELIEVRRKLNHAIAMMAQENTDE